MKQTKDEFERCIVVDALDKPMVFHEQQFYYTHSMRPKAPQRRVIMVLRSYTIKEAKELIEKHHEFREKNRYGGEELKIVPFSDEHSYTQKVNKKLFKK